MNGTHSFTFTFRRLCNDDLPLLHIWLNRPHIAQWWGGAVTSDVVQAKFQEHINSKKVFGYIVVRDAQPMAYAQAYDAAAVGEGWWPNIAPGTWGIDQSLANEEDLGKGIGSQMVHQFAEHVFKTHGASTIITDPTPENRRAIRCYEKAGFFAEGLTNTPDGIALLMKKSPPNP